MNSIQQLAAALAIAGLCGSAAAAGSLVVASDPTDVQVGDSFSLTVSGSGFSEIVVGGGFNASFAPSVLSLDSVTINTSVFEFAPGGGLIDNASGTLGDANFQTFVRSPTGNFLAATLNFTAKAKGSTQVALSSSASFPFADLDGNVINVSFGSALVNVSAVPEPSTWALMLGGAVLLPMLRRRATRA